MTERICFIHIGTHKTGTSYLQSFLCRNQERLAESGLLVPFHGRSGYIGGHHNIAWEPRRDGRFNPKRGTLATLVQEIERSDTPHTILSSEDFEHLVAADLFATVVDRLRPLFSRLVVILYLRDQPDYAVSLYTTLIRFGLSLPPPNYVDKLCRDGHLELSHGRIFEFDYCRLLEKLEAIDGCEVACRSYDAAVREGEIVDHFVGVLNGYIPLAAQNWGQPDDHINTRLDPTSVALILAATHLGIHGLLGKREAFRIHDRIIQDIHPKHEGERYDFDNGLKARIRQRFSESNRILSEIRGVHIAEP